jgi:hypothetical protein
MLVDMVIAAGAAVVLVLVALAVTIAHLAARIPELEP